MRTNIGTAKKKIVTILTTAFLLILAFVIINVKQGVTICNNGINPVVMLVSTAIYVFGSCILQTFGKPTVAVVLGVIVFFILCTCLFYSVTIVEFIVFVICMYLLMRKSTTICSCLKDCENPFK